MSIQLVGVGVGRTGTHSLKLALEQLLGGTCHHMMETSKEQWPSWIGAFTDDEPDWSELLASYCAIVDWPGAGAWRQLTQAFPDAPVLLSTRSSAEVWHKSATDTIFKSMASLPESVLLDPSSFIGAMMTSFCPDGDWRNPDDAKAAYEAHNAEIRATTPADRLSEYQPGDGWGPLCAALGIAEPDEPFPHSNSTAQFQKRMAERKAKSEREDAAD